YASTVPYHHTFDDGQTDSCSGEFMFTMQALEHTKQLVIKTHVESDTVIPHAVDSFFLIRPGTYFHARLLYGAAVFDGISHQICQHLTQQCTISATRRQIITL